VDNMNILEELQKRAEESNERWEAINSIVAEISDVMNDENSEARTEQLAELNAGLLLLLVDQLRPMAASSASFDAGEMLKGILGLGNGEAK